MRGLSLIIVFLVVILAWTSSDSPHGDKLNISCDDCHTSEGWEVDRNNISFNHDLTNFQLTGLHTEVDCKSCHETLVFSEAKPDCMSCHTDLHEQTVGLDCARCHTTNSWIVSNITEMHQMSRFPLLGAHNTADCYDCHKTASLLKFEPLGIECVDCHQSDYEATTDPNHILSSFSTDCAECHKMDAFTWSGSSFTHAFFPLTQGHAINDCSKCHTGSDFSNTSPDCFSCHQNDYLSTTSPNHQQADLPTNCIECHSTNPGWKPADFPQHDVVFPIYSGEHNGEWASCVDCHTNPNNYSLFTCIDCHEHNRSDMDEDHNGIGGYIYSSPACLECHPNGTEEGSFNHNSSNFPLTGAHISTDCIDCHSDGYTTTPSECFDCHTIDFNSSVNPNHLQLELSMECLDCHTTDPEWQPATFDVHNEYYALTGAHISTECIDCHSDGYTTTPSECFGCHTVDFNSTVNPNHLQLELSTECIDCHTTDPEWQPASFDVHNDYYPLTGAHIGKECIDCHNNGYTNTPSECFGCHTVDFNSTVNPNHLQLDLSTECMDCHTTNPEWQPASFDVHNDYYPLTGAHISTDCIECHSTGYTNTPSDCFDCHTIDFNSTINPNHVQLGLSTECMECHTTNPDWQPATFDVHNDYYPLTGAHTNTDCIDCHSSGYTNTPSECFGCHEDDYNQTVDPPHASAQFSTNCLDCHTDFAWEPSTFDHDNEYFPIYSGEHQGEWNTCTECHTNAGNYAIFSCIDCHEHNKTDMDEEHQGEDGYIYNSIACLDCHPDGSEKSIINHIQRKIR